MATKYNNSNNSITSLGYLIISLFVLSYLLNFFWESWHAFLLYSPESIPQTLSGYVKLITYVATIDGLLILLMYGIVSLIWRDLYWIHKIKNINNTKICSFIISGLIIALIIEYHALFIANKWSYNEWMPTLFGIGLSPIIQLAITGVIALFVVKRLFFNNKN